MSLRTATCNLLSHAVACCDKANKSQLCSSHQTKVSIKCETGKRLSQTILQAHVCFELYVLYLLKLPAPPRAALLVYIYIYTPFLKWPGTCRSHALHLRSHKRSQRNCEVDQSTMNLYSPISTLINPIHPPFTLNESKVWPCPARGSRDA